MHLEVDIGANGGINTTCWTCVKGTEYRSMWMKSDMLANQMLVDQVQLSKFTHKSTVS